MTIHACGTFTFAARLRENCIPCSGKGCTCCGQTGEHTEPGAKHQRVNVHGAFAENQKMWARGKKSA